MEPEPATSPVVVVIPAYREASHVGLVVEGCRPYRVIVVDDGSPDDTAAVAAAAGARVYRHVVNRGAGAATATGLKAALRQGAEVVVTLDADGQHLPAEIPRLVEPILAGKADFVIGSRLLDPTGMPGLRRLGNRVANLVTYGLYGVHVTDSQSGFRAFSARVLEAMPLDWGRYEFCSEMVAQIQRAGFRRLEVPVTALYSEYSLSKGQSFGAGLGTLARMFLRRLT